MSLAKVVLCMFSLDLSPCGNLFIRRGYEPSGGIFIPVDFHLITCRTESIYIQFLRYETSVISTFNSENHTFASSTTTPNEWAEISLSELAPSYDEKAVSGRTTGSSGQPMLASTKAQTLSFKIARASGVPYINLRKRCTTELGETWS